MYLSDDSGLGQRKKWVHRRRPTAGAGGARAAWRGSAPSVRRCSTSQCPDPPGCAPGLDAAGCRAAIRAAVREAIRLANNAASKLAAAIAVPPPHATRTANEPRPVSCSSSATTRRMPITWAGIEESGVSVVERLRAVAKELDGGRRVIFHCRPTTDSLSRRPT